MKVKFAHLFLGILFSSSAALCEEVQPKVYSYLSSESEVRKSMLPKANFIDCKEGDSNKCQKDEIVVEHDGRVFNLKVENEKNLPNVISCLNLFPAPPKDITEIVKNLNEMKSEENFGEIQHIKQGKRSFVIFFTDDSTVDTISDEKPKNISVFISTDKELAKKLNTSFPGIYGYNANDKLDYTFEANEGYMSAMYTVLAPVLDEVTMENIRYYEMSSLPIFYVFYNAGELEKISKELIGVAKDLRHEVKIGLLEFRKDKSNLKHFNITEKDIPAAISINNRIKYKDVNITAEKLKKFIDEFLDEKSEPFELSEVEPENNDKNDLKIIVRNNYKKYIEDESKDALLIFFSPRCGYCTELKPTLEKLANIATKNSNGKVIVGMIDMTKNDMPEYEIRGFPTIFLLKAKTNERVEYKLTTRTLND